MKMRNSGGTAEFFALSRKLRAIFYKGESNERITENL
jgi:hypothetical protein